MPESTNHRPINCLVILGAKFACKFVHLQMLQKDSHLWPLSRDIDRDLLLYNLIVTASLPYILFINSFANPYANLITLLSIPSWLSSAHSSFIGFGLACTPDYVYTMTVITSITYSVLCSFSLGPLWP